MGQHARGQRNIGVGHQAAQFRGALQKQRWTSDSAQHGLAVPAFERRCRRESFHRRQGRSAARSAPRRAGRPHRCREVRGSCPTRRLEPAAQFCRCRPQSARPCRRGARDRAVPKTAPCTSDCAAPGRRSCCRQESEPAPVPDDEKRPTCPTCRRANVRRERLERKRARAEGGRCLQNTAGRDIREPRGKTCHDLEGRARRYASAGSARESRAEILASAARVHAAAPAAAHGQALRNSSSELRRCRRCARPGLDDFRSQHFRSQYDSPTRGAGVVS